ncbi:MAG: alpha/beta hydrolase [Chitinophagaceae bacterium BSSC1]|nr:MAG: alpha/beta hydrolase [Chitinophagaceae bacterium BSSC1]
MYKSIPYRETELSYRKLGMGKALVLIHGFGEDGHVWDKQLAVLEQSMQVLVPDIPGTGKSDRWNEPNIDMADYAKAILAILDAEGIETCCLLGHSMGGYITLAFAELYPERLIGFGLIHSSAYADSDEKKANRLKAVELMDQYGAGAFLRNTIPTLFGANFKKEFPQVLLAQIEQAAHFDTKACQQYTLAMRNRPNRAYVLESNLLPILFVIGTEDIAAPLTDLLGQIKLPLHASIHILENVGHMGMLEAADTMTKHIMDFVENL